VKIAAPLAVVVALVLVAWGAAAAGLTFVLGVVVPYLAFLLFLGGFIGKLVKWASSPVPFHIPTVCGQQKSLPWIKANDRESLSTTMGVITRMALEVLLFRSLWRNEKVELKRQEKLVYGTNRYLWLAGLLFHWSLAFILFRHLRFFTVPVLPGIAALQGLDTFFSIGLPALYLTDIALLVALAFLLVRRLTDAQMRYISLPADYFALLLIIAIAVTGILGRHVVKVDAERVKELAMNLSAFHLAVPEGIGTFFYVHLFLVSILFAYFPYSKLMHAPGVFLSPTRNLKNDSRRVRHVNPWDYPVKVHTYEEWEDDFRDAMVDAGLPVEKGQETEVEKVRS
jgi:nitrate reductase gamma subunit